MAANLKHILITAQLFCHISLAKNIPIPKISNYFIPSIFLSFLLSSEKEALQQKLLYLSTTNYNPPADLLSFFCDSNKVSLFLSQGNISTCSLHTIISHKLKDFALAFIPSDSCIIIISSTLDKSHQHQKQLPNISHLKTLPDPMSLFSSFPHFYSLTSHPLFLPFQASVHPHCIHEAHYQLPNGLYAAKYSDSFSFCFSFCLPGEFDRVGNSC